ncbi:PIG-L family deacetylase [bacterium]|jgi:LmbE family N-acetylglucosaminyl deacetylase|nr:PIG-L family deacetylase [bacterium]
MKKTIMVIGAHADDVEFQAGGTLAKYLDKGYKGVYILATDDSAGINLDENGEYKRFLLPRESRDERHEEAKKAAALFGLEPIFLNFKQRFFCDREGNYYYFGSEEYIRMAIPESRECILAAPEKKDCVQLLTDIIKEEEPEIVLTHQLDLDPEHRNVSSLVFKAFKLAEKEVELGSLYNWGPTSAGVIKYIKPDMLVDISQYFQTKLKAFYVHTSQVGERLKRIVNQRAERWGRELGVSHGEAFLKVSPAEPDIYNQDQILAFWD